MIVFAGYGTGGPQAETTGARHHLAEDLARTGQLMATGVVTMAMAPTNRIQALIDQGAPLQIVWNQSQWTFDVWYVL
ncbi:hypothetical protein [Acidisphaera sp. L21]|uniref:hypothetical protein n=1 Tax=Acidisphaera sp. L21 TaxID=1641851 RepID=UPI00131DEE8A|nr:hypothetical protein [Acidisphaera sp. L21]